VQVCSSMWVAGFTGRLLLPEIGAEPGARRGQVLAEPYCNRNTTACLLT
jgi:hypothetical protein